MLLESDKVKVNINVADWDGCTPLMHAARKGSLDVLKALLLRNADVYAKDVRDMTALHHAAFTCIFIYIFSPSTVHSRASEL